MRITQTNAGRNDGTKQGTVGGGTGYSELRVMADGMMNDYESQSGGNSVSAKTLRWSVSLIAVLILLCYSARAEIFDGPVSADELNGLLSSEVDTRVLEQLLSRIKIKGLVIDFEREISQSKYLYSQWSGSLDEAGKQIVTIYTLANGVI